MLSVSVRVGPCPGVVSGMDVVPCVEPGSWVDAAGVNGGRFDLARPTSDISPLYNRTQILQQPVLGSAGILFTRSHGRAGACKTYHNLLFTIDKTKLLGYSFICWPIEPRKFFPSYYIRVSPAVSSDCALFFATGIRYPIYFQWVPHSCYRSGGGGYETSGISQQRLERASAAEVATVLRPPSSPGGSIRRNRGAGDVPQRLEDPAVRRVVQRLIIRHLKQVRHSAQALFARKHPGLRQSAPAALPNQRRRIGAECLEQRSHSLIGAQERQSLHSPIPRLLIRVVPVVHQRNEGSPTLDTAIPQHAKHPERPRTRRRLPPDPLNQVVRAVRSFRQVVRCKFDFKSHRANMQVIGIQRRSQEAGELP